MFVDTTQCHAKDRMLVTRDDGVRAIVCERCYVATPKCIIENFDARGISACVTEAYPHAWTYGLPLGDI
jgi:hypothetical protein